MHTKKPETSGVLREANCNGLASITGLATKSSFNAIENKIPDVINLVKKADYDAEISNIKFKYFN